MAAASPAPSGLTGSRLAGGPTTVRVATYNLLSSSLGGADYFTACKPENLAAENRLPKVLAKLALETARESVIALQEVSLAWSGARMFM